MHITDEMIERGCVALVWQRTLGAGLPPEELAELTPESAWEDADFISGEPVRDDIRRQVRAVLEAAQSA